MGDAINLIIAIPGGASMRRNFTMQGHRIRRLVAVATVGLAMMLPAHAQQAARISPAAAQAELDALIKAAKAEGEVTFYISLSENVGKRAADGFQAKYGIKTTFLRLVTAQVVQRYMAESESGNTPASVVMSAGSPAAYVGTIPKGWVEPISKSALPVLTSGEYPSRFTDGNTAIVQIAPWAIAYNNSKVKGADIPKDWTDLLNPKWKGEVLVADTSVGTVYAEFWIFIEGKYGEDFFRKISPNFRRYPGGVPAIQALAAGEGSFQLPVPIALPQGPKDKGAPLSWVVPDLNTGLETHVIMTARNRAKHPNAARLLANYVLSPEGNKVFNNEPGGVTLYDTSGLPRQYESPKPGAGARVKEMATKLGF
jgi:iron(III) transport system substrate-binding protein